MGYLSSYCFSAAAASLAAAILFWTRIISSLSRVQFFMAIRVTIQPRMGTTYMTAMVTQKIAPVAGSPGWGRAVP